LGKNFLLLEPIKIYNIGINGKLNFVLRNSFQEMHQVHTVSDYRT